ncbi:hypothetical protein EG328_007737 [Venturia inaequalis]|uniref:Uncharacterized protein n=1 Tax=Venturia inaequalis TaxID=5025 RepID=A0A8H3VG33_VENIN|nr:hypothetical protein EG328_007737 [Venturia inaequalis]KAE9989462.1 hypothetical protein EG327_002654 [Venturia inaequalis]
MDIIVFGLDLGISRPGGWVRKMHLENASATRALQALPTSASPPQWIPRRIHFEATEFAQLDVTGARAPAIARRLRHVEALGIKTVFEVFDRFTDDGKGWFPPRFAN